MTERDDFDKIVEGLDLDFEFPDEPADPVPADPPAAVDAPADDEVETEVPFYRQVSATPLVPRRGSTILAWFAVLGLHCCWSSGP